jgi:hypothetical protein
MKTRKTIIYTGKTFNVPQCIQRIDHRATHGWQLRYGGTKMFSDGAAGAKDSLARATQELCARIAKLPAPSLLQKLPNKNKSNDVPVGVSGPIVGQRRGAKVRYCSFSVSLPQFGGKARCRSVYIGSERTYTIQRHDRALEKAIQIRKKAEQIYRSDATRAKRLDALNLQSKLSERAARKANR